MNEINEARALRNELARRIRRGELRTFPEYEALSAAVGAALGAPSKVRTRWWHLDMAADAWREAADHG